MKDPFRNHCLDCQTRNCYQRSRGAKTADCLDIDYRDEVRLSTAEEALVSRANEATRKAFQRKTSGDFTLNWLTTFIREFFGGGTTVGIASCLGSIESARMVIAALEAEGMRTALATCKLGGLTARHDRRDGGIDGFPGCNPVGQARILNAWSVPVVVMVGLCIGHDMIFIRHCRAYVIPFITKMPMAFGTI